MRVFNLELLLDLDKHFLQTATPLRRDRCRDFDKELRLPPWLADEKNFRFQMV